MPVKPFRFLLVLLALTWADPSRAAESGQATPEEVAQRVR
jgi:hypothetical protein